MIDEGERILENQVPTDDPGEQLAHGGVGVSVRAPRDGNHRGKFAVAEPGECAADSGADEGDGHSGSGIESRSHAGQRKDARPDDGPDAKRDQLPRAKDSFQCILFGVFADVAQRLGGKQSHCYKEVG